MLDVAIIPAVKGRGWDPNLGQGSADRKMGLLDDANDLELLGCRPLGRFDLAKSPAGS